jgi:hypothetical protein
MTRATFRRILEDVLTFLVFLVVVSVAGLMICWAVSWITGEQILWFKA